MEWWIGREPEIVVGVDVCQSTSLCERPTERGCARAGRSEEVQIHEDILDTAPAAIHLTAVLFDRRDRT